MKPLLTIGIPTYNRTDQLSGRLSDLEKLGYFNHPAVQIIIHDNDSTNKEHCNIIKNLQKRVTNLELIESSPNIGMVKGCEKIISMAKGHWITLLGDDAGFPNCNFELARCSGVPDLQAAFLAKLRSRNSSHGDRSIFLRLGATFLHRDPWRVHRGDSYSGFKAPAGGRKRAH